jgi:hypothetical protein
MIILQYSSENGEKEAVVFLHQITRPTEQEVAKFRPERMSLDRVYLIESVDGSSLACLPIEIPMFK